MKSKKAYSSLYGTLKMASQKDKYILPPSRKTKSKKKLDQLYNKNKYHQYSRSNDNINISIKQNSDSSSRKSKSKNKDYEELQVKQVNNNILKLNNRRQQPYYSQQQIYNQNIQSVQNVFRGSEEIHSHKKIQTHQIKKQELHKIYNQSRQIQAKISIVLQSIKQNYDKRQQMLSKCIDKTINKIRQLQNQVMVEMEEMKQQSISQVQKQIYDVLIQNKKLKKIYIPSLDKVFNFQIHDSEAEKIRRVPQKAQQTLYKLNQIQLKLDPSYKKMQQIINNLEFMNHKLDQKDKTNKSEFVSIKHDKINIQKYKNFKQDSSIQEQMSRKLQQQKNKSEKTYDNNFQMSENSLYLKIKEGSRVLNLQQGARKLAGSTQLKHQQIEQFIKAHQQKQRVQLIDIPKELSQLKKVNSYNGNNQSLETQSNAIKQNKNFLQNIQLQQNSNNQQQQKTKINIFDSKHKMENLRRRKSLAKESLLLEGYDGLKDSLVSNINQETKQKVQINTKTQQKIILENNDLENKIKPFCANSTNSIPLIKKYNQVQYFQENLNPNDILKIDYNPNCQQFYSQQVQNDIDQLFGQTKSKQNAISEQKTKLNQELSKRQNLNISKSFNNNQNDQFCKNRSIITKIMSQTYLKPILHSSFGGKIAKNVLHKIGKQKDQFRHTISNLPEQLLTKLRQNQEQQYFNNYQNSQLQIKSHKKVQRKTFNTQQFAKKSQRKVLNIKSPEYKQLPKFQKISPSSIFASQKLIDRWSSVPSIIMNGRSNYSQSCLTRDSGIKYSVQSNLRSSRYKTNCLQTLRKQKINFQKAKNTVKDFKK